MTTAKEFIDKMLGKHGWVFDSAAPKHGLVMEYHIKRVADGRLETITRTIEDIVVDSIHEEGMGLDAPASVTLCALLVTRARQVNERHPVTP